MIYVICVYGLANLLFPVMFRYDNAWILLTNYSYANGMGFNNYWANPISSGIFNWHGFIQPVVIDLFMMGSSFSDINNALTLLGLAYLATWFIVVHLFVERRVLRYMLYVIGVSGALHASARPELLASLWSMLIVLALFYGRPSLGSVLRAGMAGGLVGLTVVTSPAAGIISGLGVAAAITYLRARGSLRGFILDGSVALAAAGLIGMSMLWFVYPHEPATWIAGIQEHAAVNAQRPDTGNFLKYYALTPLMPMLILPLFILIVVLSAAMNIIRNRVFAILFYVVAVIFVYFMYYSGVRIPAAYYNVTFAVPVLCLAAAVMFEHDNRMPGRGRWLSHLSLAAPLFLFAVACAFSQLVWVAQKAATGPTYATLEQEIAEGVDKYLAEGRKIGMDPPLATAVNDVSKLKQIELLFFGVNKDPQAPPPVDVLFRAQTELGEMHDDVPGFRLVLDRQSRNALTSIIKPHSLSYAIYEREKMKPSAIRRDGDDLDTGPSARVRAEAGS